MLLRQKAALGILLASSFFPLYSKPPQEKIFFQKKEVFAQKPLANYSKHLQSHPFRVRKASLNSLNSQLVIFCESHSIRKHRQSLLDNLGMLYSLGYRRLYLELVPARLQDDINYFMAGGEMSPGLKEALEGISACYEKNYNAAYGQNIYLQLFHKARSLGMNIVGLMGLGGDRGFFDEASLCLYIQRSNKAYWDKISQDMQKDGQKSLLLIGVSHYLLESDASNSLFSPKNSSVILLYSPKDEKKEWEKANLVRAGMRDSQMRQKLMDAAKGISPGFYLLFDNSGEKYLYMLIPY